MATWKKVIVSGSQAELAAVTASAFRVSATQILGPANTTGGTIITGSFSGSFAGTVTGTVSNATNATNATNAALTQIYDSSSAVGTYYPTFVNGTTGNLSQSIDTALTYVPSTDALTVGVLTSSLGGIHSAASTANLFNTTATTVNFAGAGTVINVGASTGYTSIKNDLQVTGSTTLGDASADAVTILAATVKIANVGAGSTDTVVIRDASNNLATRAIDTRVWGTTLIDASGTPSANQVPYFTDANTVAGVAGFTYTPGTSLFTAPNVLITGNMTVQGTASFQETANLAVADRFILMASGSNAVGEGGIVVQQATNGIGELFGWDNDAQRWAVTGSFTAFNTSFTPDAYMAATVIGTGTDPVAGASTRYTAKGNLFIGTDEGIWIYS